MQEVIARLAELGARGVRELDGVAERIVFPLPKGLAAQRAPPEAAVVDDERACDLLPTLRRISFSARNDMRTAASARQREQRSPWRQQARAGRVRSAPARRLRRHRAASSRLATCRARREPRANGNQQPRQRQRLQREPGAARA